MHEAKQKNLSKIFMSATLPEDTCLKIGQYYNEDVEYIECKYF